MKKKKFIPLIFILLSAFIIRLAAGIYSGAGNADAGDYTTLAIQVATQNSYSLFIDTHLGRQVIQLWLMVLVLFMKAGGATNLTAIITTALFGTFNVFLLYKIVNRYIPDINALLISLVYSIIPLIISVSQNPLYDTFLITVLLVGTWYYLAFVKTNRKISLFLSGIIISFSVFLHPSSYIYVFLFWISLPFLKWRPDFKTWAIWSILLFLIPVAQLIAWKFIYHSFYPYPKIYNEWLKLDDRGYQQSIHNISSYFKYFLVYVTCLSPLVILGIAIFLLDLRWKRDWIKIIVLLIIGTLIIGKLLGTSNILILLYVISFFYLLKQQLLKENKLLFLWGLFGTTFLFLYFNSADLIVPQTRGFSYLITFFLPISWHYLVKITKSNTIVFILFFIIFSTLFVFALIVSNEKNKEKTDPLLHKKYSVALSLYLPYYLTKPEESASLAWLNSKIIHPEQYLVSDIPGRYLPANLNMAQNHFLVVNGEGYSVQNGFYKLPLDYYNSWILANHPRFIVWDTLINNEKYNIIDKNGKRLFDFSFTQFKSDLNRRGFHQVAKVNKSILIFEPGRN